VQPASKGMALWSFAILLSLVNGVLSAVPDNASPGLPPRSFWIAGSFSMKNSIEEHYNTVEPIGLELNGVMTFFFNVFYFQYHFTKINEARKSVGLTG
jgi:hypothetical protein